MDARLRAVCLWIAALAGVISLVSIPFPPMRLILFPATIFVGGTAVFLFVKILCSRAYRRGIDAANREIQGSDPWPGRARSSSEPDWGLFGSLAGSPALRWVRAILVLGILPMGLLQNWIGMDVAQLWFAGGFVAMELSLMHVALSQPA